jgi:hypothetical protein
MDFLNVVMAESLSEHSCDSLGSGFYKAGRRPKSASATKRSTTGALAAASDPHAS